MQEVFNAFLVALQLFLLLLGSCGICLTSVGVKSVWFTSWSLTVESWIIKRVIQLVFFKATTKNFHFLVDSRVSWMNFCFFLSSSSPPTVRLFSSSFSTQQKNILYVLFDPDKSESDPATDIKNICFNYSESANLLTDGLVCWSGSDRRITVKCRLFRNQWKVSMAQTSIWCTWCIQMTQVDLSCTNMYGYFTFVYVDGGQCVFPGTPRS